MTMTVLTSCTKDKDEFSYSIIVEPGGLMTGIEAGNWRNEVMAVYQAALGTDNDGQPTTKGMYIHHGKKIVIK
jgi:hypothetical protein